MKPSNRQPTRETYAELDEAYAHFNLQLFSGRLPRCVITLNRRKGTYGVVPDKAQASVPIACGRRPAASIPAHAA